MSREWAYRERILCLCMSSPPVRGGWGRKGGTPRDIGMKDGLGER